MLDLIKSNIKINIKFYRRNRLLIAASIFILGVMGLATLPGLFYFSKTKHLDIIRMVFSELSGFATLITAGLGLLFMSHHLRSRVAKMVFTKPCSPDLWLLSSFLSAGLVSAAFYTVIFLLCAFLFLGWGLPFQWGIVIITLNQFVDALIILSLIIFLTVLFHPVIAILIMAIFNESSLYSLKLLLMSGIKNGGAYEGLLLFLKALVDLVYILMPTYSPFSDKLQPAYASFRITPELLPYTLLAVAYGLLACSLFYFLSLYFLKRKRHI